MSRRKIKFGEHEVWALDVSFDPDAESGGEKWSHYNLHDGTTLKVKPIVAEVLRIEGQYAPNGDPIYTINAQMIVAAVSPDSLKRRD
jgi:hypothetical protein